MTKEDCGGKLFFDNGTTKTATVERMLRKYDFIAFDQKTYRKSENSVQNQYVFEENYAETYKKP